MDIWTSFSFNFVLFLLGCFVVNAYQVNLLNTATATSNLRGWLVKTYVDDIDVGNASVHGWEEVSLNSRSNKTDRGYQICPKERDISQNNVQSWLRSPLIDVTDVLRIYIELRFWMRECHDLKDTMCRETFKVFYNPVNSSIHSTRNDDTLNHTCYRAIDTVAAESRFLPVSNPEALKINKEIVSLAFTDKDITTPSNRALKKNYVYIAIVDEGACMALASIRVYYNVCPQIVSHLAIFSKTYTGALDTSLIEVSGKCVDNSILVPLHMESQPMYRCASSGVWKVRTGICQCIAGFEPDDVHFSCLECPFNTSKSNAGNVKCSACPADSFTTKRGSLYCQCLVSDSNNLHATQWLSRATSSNLNTYGCELCSKVPSAPTHLSFTTNLPPAPRGTVELKWKLPTDFGRCQKITYCVVCLRCPLHTKGLNDIQEVKLNSNWTGDCVSNSLPTKVSVEQLHCNELSFFPSKCSGNHRVTIMNLRRRTRYKFAVIAVNGVSIEQYSDVCSVLMSPAQDSSHHCNSSALGSGINEKLNLLLSESSAFVLYSPPQSALPSTVTHLRLVSRNKSSATLSWHPPHGVQEEVLTYQVKWFSSDNTKDIVFDSPRIFDNISASTTIVTETSIVLTGLQAGLQYEVFVRAENADGMGNYSQPVFVKGFADESDPVTDLAIPAATEHSHAYLIAALVLIFLIVIAILICCKRSNTLNKTIAMTFAKTRASDANAVDNREDELPPEYTDATSADQRTYVDPFSLGAILPTFKCETTPSCVTTNNVIGTGEFGEVYQGTLIKHDSCGKSAVIDVAVKQLHAQCQPHEQLDFLREAMALETFKHPNIIKLEAVVTASRPHMIVTELMKHGCLGTFLRTHQEAGLAFPPVILVRMLMGVAHGMAYLSQLNYIHRDLAARNVLINGDLVCKVADFGLTRKLGEDGNNDDSNQTYTTQGGKIAIRWAAPEAVAYRSYSQASDVWSFGVFAWEVTTYGEKPYWNLTNQQVIQALNEGFRLPAPEDCPSVLHQLMLECWHSERHTRPTFRQVVAQLDNMINNQDVLQALASPASTGAEEMFFVETPPPRSPALLPTVPDAEAYHKYATCRIAAEDKISLTSLISNPKKLSIAASCDGDGGNTLNPETQSLPFADSREEPSESTSMLNPSSDNLHYPDSSTLTYKLSNGSCYLKLSNGNGSAKFSKEK